MYRINKIYFIILFSLIACNNPPSTTINLPQDSIILQLIQSKYTAQNNLDGAAHTVVDTIYILQKNSNEKDSSCSVKFHINCSYLPAPMPNGYARNPPPINADTMIILQFNNKQWQVKN